MIDSCAKLVLSEVGFCVSEFGTDSVGLLSKIYVSQVDTQQGKYEMILRSACHLCLCVHECLSGERGSEKRKCCRLCARCGFECICKSTLVRLPWKLCIFHTDMSFGASSTLDDVQLFEKKKKKRDVSGVAEINASIDHVVTAWKCRIQWTLWGQAQYIQGCWSNFRLFLISLKEKGKSFVPKVNLST